MRALSHSLGPPNDCLPFLLRLLVAISHHPQGLVRPVLPCTLLPPWLSRVHMVSLTKTPRYIDPEARTAVHALRAPCPYAKYLASCRPWSLVTPQLLDPEVSTRSVLLRSHGRPPILPVCAGIVGSFSRSFFVRFLKKAKTATNMGGKDVFTQGPTHWAIVCLFLK